MPRFVAPRVILHISLNRDGPDTRVVPPTLSCRTEVKEGPDANWPLLRGHLARLPCINSAAEGTICGRRTLPNRARTNPVHREVFANRFPHVDLCAPYNDAWWLTATLYCSDRYAVAFYGVSAVEAHVIRTGENSVHFPRHPYRAGLFSDS